MRISVESHIKDVTKGLTQLRGDIRTKAELMALNRTGITVRAETVRSLQAELQLKNQAMLRKAIQQSKATKGDVPETIIYVNERAINIDLTKLASVSVTRRGKGKSKKRVTVVRFKGKVLDGAIQVSLAGKRTIRAKDAGRYSSGKKSAKIKPVYAYTTTQEYFRAKIDETQERVTLARFPIEFDRALGVVLRALRFQG